MGLKRGEKDFESHGTRAQKSVLDASRQAMHEALSAPRLHNANAIIGYLDADDYFCVIDDAHGSNLRTVGTSDSQNRLHLLPEECLYLVERGSLTLQWRHEDLKDIPLSLQTVYAYLIGNDDLTLERYVVYAALKRSGYIIQRAPTFHPSKHSRVIRDSPPSPATPPFPTLFQRLYISLLPPTQTPPVPPCGPLVQPGLYRSYAPMYAQLSLIPFHNPTIRSDQIPSPLLHHPPLRPTYHVWKPDSSFRKSAPPPPDYRICILDAREDAFPALEQLDDLLQCMPYEPPPRESEGKTYQRLRHGYRSVILAIVDQGIVSYVRVGDAGFGCEPVWDRRQRGGKRGGGRGRGLGRGRGGRARGS